MPHVKEERIHYITGFPEHQPKDPEYAAVEMKKLITCDRWNSGLACATGEELKLIRVLQEDYPFDIIEEVVNNFILEFNDGGYMICPGHLHRSKRIDFVGPRYARLKSYIILPENPLEVKITRFPDMYLIARKILNDEADGLLTPAQIKMAQFYLRQKAVVVQ